MKQTLLALAVLVFGGISAHADLLLEPYAAYHTGKLGGSKDYDISGVSLGGRVGYQKMGFMIGGDYMTGSWKWDTPTSYDVTPNELGVFVGFNFPILLRVYGEYGLSNELKLKNSNGKDTRKGDFIKLGAQFTGLPFVAIGLEYITAQYDEADAGTLHPDDNMKMWGLVVSVPFDL